MSERGSKFVLLFSIFIIPLFFKNEIENEFISEPCWDITTSLSLSRSENRIIFPRPRPLTSHVSRTVHGVPAYLLSCQPPTHKQELSREGEFGGEATPSPPPWSPTTLLVTYQRLNKTPFCCDKLVYSLSLFCTFVNNLFMLSNTGKCTNLSGSSRGLCCFGKR